MLSSGSLLNQGKYRIKQRMGNIRDAIVYEALDNFHGTDLLIAASVLTTSRVLTATERGTLMQEFDRDFEASRSIKSDRVIPPVGHFVEIDRRYLVFEIPENLETLSTGNHRFHTDIELVRETDAWLEMIAEIHQTFPDLEKIDITPITVRVADDGAAKLLFFGDSGKRSNRTTRQFDEGPELACLPLESIWSQLDSASQKAISHNYSDQTLELLESGCDVRSDIYSMAAVMYQIATGTPPPSALERSIEILDGGRDPLTVESFVNAGHSEGVGDFMIKALAIRREDRFDTIAQARALLSAVPITVPATPAAEDIDLLELPPVTAIHTTPTNYSRPQTPFTAAKIDHAVSSRPADEAGQLFGHESAVPEWDPKLPTQNSTPDILDSKILDSAEIHFTREPAEAAMFGMTEQASGRSGSRKFVWAAAAAVVVISGVIYGVISIGQNAQVEVASPQAAVTGSTPASVVVLPTPAPTTEPIVDDSSANASTVVETEDLVPQNTQKQRPAIAEARPAKKPADAAATRPNQTPKKKVTVDDLINDN